MSGSPSANVLAALIVPVFVPESYATLLAATDTVLETVLGCSSFSVLASTTLTM